MRIKYLCLIQARIGSTRLPNKVMQTVGGIPMVKRVWNAAQESKVDKIIVAWPERYPDLDENNVLERFRRLAFTYQPDNIVRLTADCPLITTEDINLAIDSYELSYRYVDYRARYYNNRRDGHDVQIFSYAFLFHSKMLHKEHVIDDIPNTGGLSVNTKEDLQRVRAHAR